MLSNKTARTITSKQEEEISGLCSISEAGNVTNDVDTEIETYFAQSRVKMNPIEFWTQQKNSCISVLALQLLSVPCSSAPVERLFSKAGIVLSQRSRLSSMKLEKLLFVK